MGVTISIASELEVGAIVRDYDGVGVVALQKVGVALPLACVFAIELHIVKVFGKGLGGRKGARVDGFQTEFRGGKDGRLVPVNSRLGMVDQGRWSRDWVTRCPSFAKIPVEAC